MPFNEHYLAPQLEKIKGEGKLKLGVHADYTDLYRHYKTLHSEEKIDAAERAGVEKSVVGRELGALVRPSHGPGCG